MNKLHQHDCDCCHYLGSEMSMTLDLIIMV